MDVVSTAIPGLMVFTPTPHLDDRGFFSRTFDADVARSVGVDPHAFVQDSLSRSKRGVVRGMHVRVGKGENKLVRCSAGSILDVVVDLRQGSPTFLEWLGFELSGESQVSVYVPAGCAHGFQALSEPADISYRIDQRHEPGNDLTIAHDDPELAIAWPQPISLMSQADRDAPRLSEVRHRLDEIRPNPVPNIE
jgi:dTDP-4-dehydrorhamnose 3,5-epimerase